MHSYLTRSTINRVTIAVPLQGGREGHGGGLISRFSGHLLLQRELGWPKAFLYGVKESHRVSLHGTNIIHITATDRHKYTVSSIVLGVSTCHPNLKKSRVFWIAIAILLLQGARWSFGATLSSRFGRPEAFLCVNVLCFSQRLYLIRLYQAVMPSGTLLLITC